MVWYFLSVMNIPYDERVDTVIMNKERTVSMLNDLIFRAIVHGAIAGGLYESNRDDLIAAVLHAIQHFELADHEVGEVIREHDYIRWSFPGLVKMKEQRRDTVKISEEDKTTGQNDELEELMAEAMEIQWEGVEPEPLTLGALAELLATMPDEDDDENPD